MAASITISGRLGRDPEVKQAGTSEVVEVSVAVTHRAKSGGSWEDVTTWYRVTAWDASSRGTLQRFTRKGSLVIVAGELQPRSYKDKQGVERVSLEIRAAMVEAPRTDAGRQPDTGAPASPNAGQTGGDDDLPF